MAYNVESLFRITYLTYINIWKWAMPGSQTFFLSLISIRTHQPVFITYSIGNYHFKKWIRFTRIFQRETTKNVRTRKTEKSWLFFIEMGFPPSKCGSIIRLSFWRIIEKSDYIFRILFYFLFIRATRLIQEWNHFKYTIDNINTLEDILIYIKKNQHKRTNWINELDHFLVSIFRSVLMNCYFSHLMMILYYIILLLLMLLFHLLGFCSPVKY